MYLSRLILNPQSRQVQRELADIYQMHRTILSAFPLELPQGERILYRLEERTERLTLLVQSQNEPDWEKIADPRKGYLLTEQFLPTGWENPAVKPLDLKFSPGQELAFRLLVNPTKKKKVDGKDNGQRVGIYKEEEQLNWLKRKIEDAGCMLLEARTSQHSKMHGSRFEDGQKHNLTYSAVQFDGLLEVVDTDKLLIAIKHGIGSGKGLGFGLLSLGPSRLFQG